MKLETVPEGLAIQEEAERFVLRLEPAGNPLENLVLRAALGVVSSAPESDGKERAWEILMCADDKAIRLAFGICVRVLSG